MLLETLPSFKYFYGVVEISDMYVDFPMGPEILEPTTAPLSHLPGAFVDLPQGKNELNEMVFASQIATREQSLGGLWWGLASAACCHLVRDT